MSLENYQGKDNLEVMKSAVNYNNYLKHLVRINCADQSSILDFGAGVGTFTDSFGLPPETISCVEPDLAARQSLQGLGYQVFSDLKETETKFSYIFSLNVLEHIEDDQGAVDELFRALKPGGSVFIYTPAFEFLFSTMDEKVGHFRRYNIHGLKKVVEDSGFRVRKLAYTDSLGFFATLAFKLLKSDSDGSISETSIKIYDKFLFPISRLLSAPLAKILGKNVFVVAVKPT